MKNFDLDYKLEQFRKEHLTDLFDENCKRHTGVCISNSQAEIMLELINELEAEVLKIENGTMPKRYVSELLHLFWQRTSDACPIEAVEAEQQELEFADWINTINFDLPFPHIAEDKQEFERAVNPAIR